MMGAEFPRIHPTAIVSAEAELADDVQVGPFCVIEGKVRIGPGCVLRPQVYLRGPLTMGKNNTIYTGAVLGERPQHTKYNDEPTSVEIGDDNIFREYVTVHKGTSHSWVTRIGSGNFFMANSHIAHDCQVGNRCILANGALLAGHCVLEDQCYISGNSAVHQFVRIGRLALLSGTSCTTKDMPPFVMQQGINCIVGINVVGMRRAGISNAEIQAVHQAFHILFRSGLMTSVALEQIDRSLSGSPAVAELAAFIRRPGRGISTMRAKGREAA
jgi:UDP-N-acetylglucosamine acyltransferase